MLADQLTTRIGTIEALEGRVKTAADLSEMISRNELPNSPAAAFVVPGGLRPRGLPEGGTGAHLQEVDEIMVVVLIVRAAADATGAKGLVRLDPLILDVLGKVCGWEPADTPDNETLPIGDFRLSRGQLLSMKAGTLIYQLEFACPLQLRILA
jgi:hypothetical protein